MHTDTLTLYSNYRDLLQKAADIQYASAVLGWDQEVYMPPAGYVFRGRQLATLASVAHEMLTGELLGGLLHELAQSDDRSDAQKANVRLSSEDYYKAVKLPAQFVEELTNQSSRSYNVWLQARKENDYNLYEPELKKMIVLKRQQADLYGFEAHPYDALLDEYEKGATVAMLDPVFKMVREQLTPFLKKISEGQQVSNDFFHQYFPKEKQWDFSLAVLDKMGYDRQAGRQDFSEHPFTTTFAPTDVRITTRVDVQNFASLLWSSIHEGGHALYEQGLPEDEYGMPLGSPASLSVHESQSRLWENCIGRGLPFWTCFYPLLQQYFPDQLQNVSLHAFYKGMNQVKPSLVRTEADEITYHFHVMIRYEIEKALIDGTLDPKNVADAWSDMYHTYLGIRPASHRQGVLQDVHWCHGSFGYFPTYSLGSFYAAQFFEQAHADMPGLTSSIEAGDFKDMLQWLRRNIHIHGRRYTSEQLCINVTGRGLDFSSFMRYIQNKYMGIY